MRRSITSTATIPVDLRSYSQGLSSHWATPAPKRKPAILCLPGLPSAVLEQAWILVVISRDHDGRPRADLRRAIHLPHEYPTAISAFSCTKVSRGKPVLENLESGLRSSREGEGGQRQEDLVDSGFAGCGNSEGAIRRKTQRKRPERTGGHRLEVSYR